MANNVTVGFGTKGVSKASSDLDKLKDKFTKLQSQGAKGFAIGVGVAAAGAALGLLKQGAEAAVGGIEDSIKAASDLNETLQKSGVVFGDSEASIESWGKTAAKSMGLSENAAVGAAASIGNLLRSTGTAASQIAPMSMGIVKLASDLASFNNIPVEDALAKLQSGLVGQERPLRELGVAISAASVDAEAAALGFHKVNGTFTEGEKVQARYSLIFKQTGTAQGDFARTSDQLANSQRIVNAEMEDASAKIGTALTPKVTQLEKFLANDFIPTAMNTADVLGTVIPQALSPLASAVDFVDTAISQTAIDLINTNNRIGAIPVPWHHAAEVVTASAADMSNAVTGLEGTADKAVGDMSNSMTGFERTAKYVFKATATDALNLAADYDKTQRRIRKANADTVTQLDADAKALIDKAFGPIIAYQQLAGDNATISASKRVIASKKASDAEKNDARDTLNQTEQDAAGALLAMQEAGNTNNEVFKTGVANLKTEIAQATGPTKTYLQGILDQLHAIDSVKATPIIAPVYYPPKNLPASLKNLGYTGNTDLLKAPPKKAPVRAAGGPVSANEPYVVGEKGPELFVPGQSGAIVPNGGSAGSAMAGPTFNITINAGAGSGLTPGGARQLAADIGPALYADMQRKGFLPRSTGLRG